MQGSEDFSDVVLWVGMGGPRIRGHKVILATGSNFFRKLFTQNPDSSVFTITDVEYKELSMLVDFIYKGEIDVALEDIDELLKGGKKLQVLGLMEEDKDSRLNHHSDSRATASCTSRHLDFSQKSPRESRNHSDAIAKKPRLSTLSPAFGLSNQNHVPESSVLGEDDEVVFIEEVNPKKQTSTPMVKLTYNSSARRSCKKAPVVSEPPYIGVIAASLGVVVVDSVASNQMLNEENNPDVASAEAREINANDPPNMEVVLAAAEVAEFNQSQFQENSSSLEPRQVNLPPEASSTPLQVTNNNNAPATNVEVDLSLMPDNTLDDEMWNSVDDGEQVLGSGTPINNTDATQAAESVVTRPAPTAADVERQRQVLRGEWNQWNDARAWRRRSRQNRNAPVVPKSNVEADKVFPELPDNVFPELPVNYNPRGEVREIIPSGVIEPEMSVVQIDGFRITNEIEAESKFKMTRSKKWKCLQCGLVTKTKHNILKHIRASAADHKKKPKTKKN